MGTATSRRVGPAVRPQGEQKDWPIFVCQQGAFLFDPRAYFPVDADEAKAEFSAGVELNPDRGRVALPPCRKRDTLLDQPPLGLKLSEAEARNLIDDTIGAAHVLAATDVGPLGQDKASNQDFALAATIRASHRGRTTGYQFAAVADGVTTRTLWPERSARLAVFAAWRAARQHVEAGRDFSHQSFDLFRDHLIGEIRRCLETDHNILLRAGQIPSGWSEDAYRQFRERGELWYNTTLHVVLVGPEAGFALSCGDGGLVVRKHKNRETKSVVLVRSTDDLSVSGIVSLGPDSMRFRQTRITLDQGTSLDIIVATDGVDRSLRREAGNDAEDFDPYGPDFLGSPMSALFNDPQGFKGMVDLRLAHIANREIDNVSTAVLHWPSPDMLPTPPSPVYSRGIVATGETVEDINSKMAAGQLPPPAPMPPQMQPVAGPPTATLVPRLMNPPASNAVSPLPFARSGLASKFSSLPSVAKGERATSVRSPPSGSRSGPAARPSPPLPPSRGEPASKFLPPSFSEREGARTISPPPSSNPRSNAGQRGVAGRQAHQGEWQLDRDGRYDLETAFIRITGLCLRLGHLDRRDYELLFEQLLACIRVDIGGPYLDRKFGCPTFCKLLFYFMADIYASDPFKTAAATNPAIERLLDEYLGIRYGRAPSFSRKDIEFDKRYDVIDAVSALFRRTAVGTPMASVIEALGKL